MDIFRYLFCMMFSDKSIYMQMKTGAFEGGSSKNTVYRFLNNARINWQRFTTLLSADIICSFMKPLTDGGRKDAFIVDDSLFGRSRSKKAELLARVFDHCSMKYRAGFRMLALAWSDGNSTVPVSHCVLSAAEDKNLLCAGARHDGRSLAGRRRLQSRRKATDVMAGLVLVRNKSKRKDWLVLVSTDTSLSEEEIIRIYGKRWDIEVFFKACKSCLKLVKEYRGTSYDAMNAHAAIVFARYMMLSVAQRENGDDKTTCELCFCLLDEMAGITFSRSMCIIIDALMDTVAEYFHITEAQPEEFTASFIQRLPKHAGSPGAERYSCIKVFCGAKY